MSEVSSVQITKIAAAAEVDPRTVRSYLAAPNWVRMTDRRKRVAKALVDLGLQRLVRTDAPTKARRNVRR